MNRFLLFLFVLTLGACQTPETETVEPTAAPVTNASDPADDRAALQAMTATYQTAIRAGDHAAIAALHADDAVIQPANSPAERGRAALDAYFEATDSEPEDLTFTTDDLVIAESGDLAYEVGTTTGPGVAGKYLTVFRRTPAGWRIVADSWSDDTPPAGGSDG
ncbi:MAG: DUF4440 domain-containing protein [Rhodothermales bacterium]